LAWVSSKILPEIFLPSSSKLLENPYSETANPFRFAMFHAVSLVASGKRINWGKLKYFTKSRVPEYHAVLPREIPERG
jgi:hypothetical protein